MVGGGGMLFTLFNVDPGVAIIRSKRSKSDESPLKGDTPVLIKQGFMNPGLSHETLDCF